MFKVFVQFILYFTRWIPAASRYFHKSMPYSLHTHATARGGNNWLRDLAPNSANLLRLPLNQRRKVLQLTPAAFASSFLYIAFMLQSYEIILNYANKLAIIYQA